MHPPQLHRCLVQLAQPLTQRPLGLWDNLHLLSSLPRYNTHLDSSVGGALWDSGIDQ